MWQVVRLMTLFWTMWRVSGYNGMHSRGQLRRFLSQRVSAARSAAKTTLPQVEYGNFAFNILSQSKDSMARTGLLKTPHGDVQTPNFIFCGTRATVKSLTPDQLRDAGAQFMLSNTYHLMLSPGSEVVKAMGGLQKFSGWKGG